MHHRLIFTSILFLTVYVLTGELVEAQDVTDNEPSESTIKGVITTSSGANNGRHAFTDISWGTKNSAFYYDASGAMTRAIEAADWGTYTDEKGADTKFSNNSVVSILFVNDAYRQAINSKYSASIGTLVSQETTLPLSFSELLTSDEFTDVARYFSILNEAQSYGLQPYIQTLSPYIDKFKSGMRLIDGKWIPRRQDSTIGVYGPTSVTLNGQLFQDVYLNPAPNTNQIYVLTADGGTTVDYSSLTNKVNALPPEIAKLILNQTGSEYIDSLPTDHSTISPQDFIPTVEQAMITYHSLPNITNALAEISSEVVLGNVHNPARTDYLWQQWPTLCKCMSFPTQERQRFYDGMVSSANSIDDLDKIIDYVSKNDPSCAAGEAISQSISQLNNFKNIQSSFDKVISDFLSDPRNSQLFKNEPTLGEPAISMPPGSDQISLQIDRERDVISLPDLKQRYTVLSTLWKAISTIPGLRSSLLSNDLNTALNVDSQLDLSLPNLDQVEQQGLAMVQKQISFVGERKAMVDKLVNDADAIINGGGNEYDALSEYQKAYQLDKDPAIQLKIEQIKKQSLGI